MVNKAREISFTTFAKNCDYQELARSMGYAVGREKGLHLKDDLYVRFYVSEFEGKKVYFINQSAIEWIFA
jgi:hypothetical protein